MTNKETFLQLSYSAKDNNPRFYALLEAIFLDAPQLRRYGTLMASKPSTHFPLMIPSSFKKRKTHTG